MTIFERATRNKFRFTSPVGLLSVEQVWELPLMSHNGINLEAVAQAASKELKAAGTESFVPDATTKVNSDLEMKLDVVKRIIEVKVAERDLAQNNLMKAEKRRKILDALAEKREQALSQASVEDLEKQLEEIDAM